jgi:hypothetical protein
VPRLVNACGSYTDLDGSGLRGRRSHAADEASRTWAAMDDLPAGSGIAAACGREAARVVQGPGAAEPVGVLAEGDPACARRRSTARLCWTEALTGDEVREIGAAMSELWPN